MQREEFSLAGMEKIHLPKCSAENRIGDWIQTYPKVTRFWPLDPRPEEIFIENLACSLSNLCRFTGYVNSFYSVGQHSIIVSKLCSPENALAGLMHDTGETGTNDIARPVKPFLPGLDKIEDDLLEMIFVKYGINWPVPEEVKTIDHKLCITEARDLGLDITQWGDYGKIVPYDFKIEPLGAGESAPLFIHRFNELELLRKVQ